MKQRILLAHISGVSTRCALSKSHAAGTSELGALHFIFYQVYAGYIVGV